MRNVESIGDNAEEKLKNRVSIQVDFYCQSSYIQCAVHSETE